MTLDQELVDRFHSMHTTGDGCWSWLGALDRDGYGRMRVGGRKTLRAHRLAWEIETGRPPGSLLVCHHCDNPPCVNPAHLFLGTARDNNRDRVQKGRPNGSPGESNGVSKLTASQVHEIANLYCTGRFRQQDLAEMFGVSKSAIQLILSGKNWKSEGVAPVEGMRRAPRRSRRRLSDETRASLIARYAGGGVSQAALAEEYGVSQSYVSQAVRRT